MYVIGVISILYALVLAGWTAAGTILVLSSPKMRAFMGFEQFVTSLVDIVLCVVLVAGAIGILMVQRWGRVLMLVWAYGALACVAIEAVYAIISALINSKRLATILGADATAQGMLVGFLIVALISALQSIWPTIVLTYLRSESVKGGFEPVAIEAEEQYA